MHTHTQLVAFHWLCAVPPTNPQTWSVVCRVVEQGIGRTTLPVNSGGGKLGCDVTCMYALTVDTDTVLNTAVRSDAKQIDISASLVAIFATGTVS